MVLGMVLWCGHGQAQVAGEDPDPGGWWTEDPPSSSGDAKPDGDAPSADPTPGNPSSAADTASGPVPAPTPARTVTLGAGERAVVATDPPLTIDCEGCADCADCADDGPPKRVRRRWYGWQTLIADLALLGFILDADPEATESSGYYLAGMATSAPVIHLANGQPGNAAKSLALRGGSLGFFALIVQDDSTAPEDQLLALTIISVVLIHPAATAIDAAVFARKRERAPRPLTARAHPRVVGFSPMIGREAAHPSWGAALTGTF